MRRGKNCKCFHRYGNIYINVGKRLYARQFGPAMGEDVKFIAPQYNYKILNSVWKMGNNKCYSGKWKLTNVTLAQKY